MVEEEEPIIETITNTFEDKTWEDNIIEICKSTLPQEEIREDDIDEIAKELKLALEEEYEKSCFTVVIGSATSYKKISEEVMQIKYIVGSETTEIFIFYKST